MSSSMIQCPNCGSVNVTSTKPDEYRCMSCRATFNFIRPDIKRHDVVSHNCPICGKPIEAGRGFRCTRCGKYDLCEDCVEKLIPEGYVCKTCLKEAGQDCFICGKFGYITCKSCEGRYARGETDVIVQVCDECYPHWFVDYIELEPVRNGMPPRWGAVTYYCPRCRQICNQCVEEKKRFLRGKTYVCKNCGSELQITEVEMNGPWKLVGDEIVFDPS